MKKIIAGFLIAAVSSGLLFFKNLPDGRLHVFFLNIGQGDAVLIRTPSGKNILVDAGPKNNVLPELAATLPYWRRRLDYIVPTHPDLDHIEGFVAVVQRMRVDRALMTGVYRSRHLLHALLEGLLQKHIPVILADQNTDLNLHDGVIFDVIYPFEKLTGFREDTNNASIVARIVYGKNTILLTGDAEAPTEEKLLAAGAPLAATVLKVAHHGSKTGTTAAFLRAVHPLISAISAGKANPYHHPHPSVVTRLQQCTGVILRTDLDGRIELVFSKEGLEEIRTEERGVVPKPDEEFECRLAYSRLIRAPKPLNFSSNLSYPLSIY